MRRALLSRAAMDRTCYGLLGYKPTDPDLDLLSLRQYLDAVMGHLAAGRIHASLIASAMSGDAEPAGELLGLPLEGEHETGPADVDAMKDRRPHWFD